MKLKEDGYKIAVCSNSIRATVESLMRLSNLSKHIDYIVSNEDVKKGKPDPEMYLKAMEYFNLKPAEALILEDNEHGIAAAKSSGGHLMKIDLPEDIFEFKLKNEKVNSFFIYLLKNNSLFSSINFKEDSKNILS